MLKRLADFLLALPQEENPAAAHDRAAVATCVLLLEAARADFDFRDDERRHILEVLRSRFDLSEEEATDLFHAADEVREESSDLWRFTRTLNETYSTEEKIEVVEELWRLMYSDGVLSGHEDHLIHKLRTLLNLNHKQLIDAKMRVLDERRGD
jgi:uncharacterized tellurite resistance protein B-like protein